MRTRTAWERLVIKSATVRHHLKVEVADASDVFQDRSSFAIGAQFGENVDTRVMGGSMTLRRASGSSSLAPTMFGSPLNSGGAAIERGRRVRLSSAVTQTGLLPGTNYLVRSEQFDNAAWTKTTGVTVTADATTAPDGTVTADQISYNGTGTSGSFRIFQTAGGALAIPANGQAFTTSVWLRAAAPITLQLHDNAGSPVTINITTTWQRFFISDVGNGVGAGQLLIYSAAGSNVAFTIFAWGAMMDLGSALTDYVQTVATAFLTSWKEMFLGRIDSIDWSQDPIKVAISDQGAWLQDTQIQSENSYASSGGTAVETVMQSILNDWPSGKGVPTLLIPTSPAWNIKTFKQQRNKVFDALGDLAAQIAWDCRFRYDANGVAQLTLMDPNRSNVTPADSIGPSEYSDVTSLQYNLANIRNSTLLKYTLPGGTPATATSTDATSITKYGLRYIELPSAKNVDSSTEANKYVAGVINDLSDSGAEQEIQMLYFWPVQLFDLYTFVANNVHYDVNTNLAVQGYQHQFENGFATTTIKASGRIIGSYNSWIRRFIGRAVDGIGNIDLTGTAFDNKNVDNVGDGSTYSRTLGGRVNAGRPLINYAENINLSEEVVTMRQWPGASGAVYSNALTSGGVLSQWFSIGAVAFGTVEFDVKAKTGGLLDVMLWDSNDGASKPNGYIFRFDTRTGQSSGQILKITSGAWSPVGTAKTSYNPVNAADLSGWHRVRIKAVGGVVGQFDIYVDGLWSWSTTDSTYQCNSGQLYVGTEVASPFTVQGSKDASTTADKVVAQVGGGTNKLTNSSFENVVNQAADWSMYNNGPETATASIQSSGGWNGPHFWRTTWAVPSTSQKGVFRNDQVLKANQWYTLSFYAKLASAPSVAGGMGTAWNHAPDLLREVLNPNLTTSFQRYVFRFQWTVSTVDTGIFMTIAAITLAANSIDIDAIQLEEGEVATTYTPITNEFVPRGNPYDDGSYAATSDSSGKVYLLGAGVASSQSVNVGTPSTPASMQRVYRIPFSAFAPNDTAVGADKTHNDIRPKVVGSTVDFLAPVILPQGSTIVLMSVRGFRNAVGDFLTVTLQRTIDGTLFGVTSVSIAASAAWVTGNSSTLSEAVNTSFMYFVDAAFISSVSAGDTRLGYVEITVTVPTLNVGL